MAWTEKEKPTLFDNKPISGLFFLDGDLLGQEHTYHWVKGQKMPMIAFPSGIECQLWESSDPENGIVHIFGEMDLPLRDTRDDAYIQAQAIAKELSYHVQKIGENGLSFWMGDDFDHLVVTYDNEHRHMTNIELVENDPETTPKPLPLLDDETRARLPKLYSQEKLGLEALAQVKFFTPFGHWTWYGSEFDGEDIFFGLVAGDAVELGYFSLSELEELRGQRGTLIERDLHFTPKTLRELRELHERG